MLDYDFTGLQLHHSALNLFLPFSYFRLKLLEIKAGVDGFMVHDLGLIEPMQKVSP